MMDLDHFKRINDNFGHPMGDEVLRRIAMILLDSVRAEDSVCRYGGEEFAIIAPNVFSGAAELAERLRKNVEESKYNFGGQEVTMTMSIGVATSSERAEISLIEHADAALYRAKDAGRNRVEVAGAEFAVPAAEK
jgi:diguanylate cyclase (GGDEF)-like protein